MPDKVIFLDIDGPMIPATSFIIEEGNPSFDQKLDSRCVKVLHKILELSQAKIVFNSTHNTALEKDNIFPGLLNSFRDAGFESYLHEDVHTVYPGVNRLTAINEWLLRNRTDQMLWVAFDDVFIDHKRAYLTDFHLGIGYGEYRHAGKYLHYETKIVM